MEQDLVCLVWKDVKTGNKYKVAKLYMKTVLFTLNIFLRMLKMPKNMDSNY